MAIKVLKRWYSIFSDDQWSDLIPEEQAIILDDSLGKDITTEDIECFAPGYKQRILSGLLEKIAELKAEAKGRVGD